MYVDTSTFWIVICVVGGGLGYFGYTLHQRLKKVEETAEKNMAAIRALAKVMDQNNDILADNLDSTINAIADAIDKKQDK